MRSIDIQVEQRNVVPFSCKFGSQVGSYGAFTCAPFIRVECYAVRQQEHYSERVYIGIAKPSASQTERNHQVESKSIICFIQDESAMGGLELTLPGVLDNIALSNESLITTIRED